MRMILKRIAVLIRRIAASNWHKSLVEGIVVKLIVHLIARLIGI